MNPRESLAWIYRDLRWGVGEDDEDQTSQTAIPSYPNFWC